MKRYVKSTSKIYSSAIVRPVTFGDYGVYVTEVGNRATLVFEGTQDECYEWIKNNGDTVESCDTITSSADLDYGGDRFVPLSDWLEIETDYVTEDDEDLYDYADKSEGYEDENGVVDYPVSYFKFDGQRYALGRFLGRYGMMGFDKNNEYYPEFIHGYDSEEYFNPVYIEISSGGDSVRLWEEVK